MARMWTEDFLSRERRMFGEARFSSAGLLHKSMTTSLASNNKGSTTPSLLHIHKKMLDKLRSYLPHCSRCLLFQREKPPSSWVWTPPLLAATSLPRKYHRQKSLPPAASQFTSGHGEISNGFGNCCRRSRTAGRSGTRSTRKNRYRSGTRRCDQHPRVPDHNHLFRR